MSNYSFIFIFTLLLISFYAHSQRINPHQDDLNHSHSLLADISITVDTTYDVKFYHLDLEIAIDSVYLGGNVNYLITSKIEGLNSIILNLDEVFVIDSISSAASSYSFSNSELTIDFSNTYNYGESIAFTVYYHGNPRLAGGYKGLRYETHDDNEPIIASLSTPYLAHYWWPSKDGPSDKADSTFVDITIKDTIIDNLPVIALSNGILETVETVGNMKTFKWRHRYPIVPYYVMAAISNYDHFQQIYEGDGYTMPLDYYVFDSHKQEALTGVAELMDAIEFFEEIFGPYPFPNEKYGMTQLGYYGAIENQTNTITNNMSLDWFYVTIHELAHQWFADMITCTTWNHGWLNEGFASYAEALYEEHAAGFNSYKNYVEEFEFYDSGNLYMEDVSNPFQVFQTIIYDKGAYVLHMLRGVLGDDVFFSSIKHYATYPDFKYKNTTTEDFQNICEFVSGLDLEYFFDQWIYDERYPIYHYNYQYHGFDEKVRITVQQKQNNSGWREVFIMPMEFRIVFTDQTDTIITDLNDARTQSFSFEVDKEVEYIQLDPNDWILKDVQFDPNVIVGALKTEQYDFQLFPNPAARSIQVQLLSPNVEANISIFDIHGRQILNSRLFSDSGGQINLNIEDITTGIYFLKIESENTNAYNRFSVIR